MKRLILTSCACVVFATVFVAQVSAAPAFPVTKPPLQPVPSWTGPVQDPHAIQGQWFRDATGQESVRPYEFYDNIAERGGSPEWGSLAIEGYVQNITYDGAGKITGFGIKATITNDDRLAEPNEEGGNSHGEWTDPRDPYHCNLYQTKLTVEFADDGILGNLPLGGVYLPEQNIYAKNYDELAWYCWTPVPENPLDPEEYPRGGYIVPTYDFGDIMHEQSVERILEFGLYSPEAPGSELAEFLQAANANGWDVFANRTMSLKISDYIDNLAIDDGSQYPAPPFGSSDVSVFFIPEPATICLLTFGGFVLLRRKSA